MTRPNRRSVRVKDVVRIQYEIVPEDQLEQARHTIDFLRLTEAERYPFRPRPLERIADENLDPNYRSLADVLRRLDQKMDFIIHSLDRISESSTDKAPGEVVRSDMSGTGMQFACSETFPPGAFLRITLYLGSYITKPIHMLTKVLRVEDGSPEWGPQPYRVAVEYEYIAEEDSETVISHVFDVQRAQLRATRLEKIES